MNYGTIIVILLVIALLGGLPAWGYHSLSYYPSGFFTVLLVIVLVLIFTGRL